MGLHFFGPRTLSRRVWQIWLSGVLSLGSPADADADSALLPRIWSGAKAKAAIDMPRGQAD
jgi:hypothetical protein